MNKYDVLGRVGEGAYGVVLRCKNKDTNEIVAIKKFKESEEDEVVRKTTLREIKILRILRHENIVQLKEAFRRNKKLYLVFEFVEKSMLDILEENERGVDTETVRVLTYQLTRAIEYCHKQEVIHRDIKPENLLINPADNALRLCDFGFARHYTTEAPLTDYVATRWYRAPELLLCSTNYGKDVDIWALGCIMGELTDGQPLFAGETEVDMLFMIQKVLGALTAEHMEMFLRNPRFLGVQFPDVSRPETLEKRYMRRMPKLQMQLLKGVLAMEPKRRLTAKDAVRMPWFEGVKLPRSLRPPSQTHTQLRPDSSNSVATATHSRDREAPRDARENPRDSREAARDSRDPRDMRETREMRDPRDAREPQAMPPRGAIAGVHLGNVAAPQAVEPTWLDPESRESTREEPLRVARDDPRMLREDRDARPRTEQQQRRTVFEDSILEVGPSPEYGNMPLHFGEVDDKMSDGRRSRQQRRQGTAETVCSTTSNGGGALVGPSPGAATNGAGPRLWVSAGTGGSEEWPSAQLSRAPRSLREPDGPEDAAAAWGQNGLPRRKVGRQPTGLGAIPQTRRTPELVDQWQPPGDPRNQAWDVPQDLKEMRPPTGAGGLPMVTGPFPLGPQGLPGQMLGEISRGPSRLAANTPTPREDALDLAKLHSFGLGAEFGHVRDLRSLHHDVRPPAQALTALGRR